MSDVIYRQDAIDAVSELLKGIFVEHDDIAKGALNNVSSAESEIVRCKDCKLFGNSEQLPSAQP